MTHATPTKTARKARPAGLILTIEKTAYAVDPMACDPLVAERAFRLLKADGTVYDLAQTRYGPRMRLPRLHLPPRRPRPRAAASTSRPWSVHGLIAEASTGRVGRPGRGLARIRPTDRLIGARRPGRWPDIPRDPLGLPDADRPLPRRPRRPVGRRAGRRRRPRGDRAGRASTRRRSTRRSSAASSRRGWARPRRGRWRSGRGCRRRSSALTVNMVCGSGLRAVMLAGSADPGGRCRARPGRRHGEHEQRPPPAPGGPVGLEDRRPAARRLDAPRRPDLRHRGLADGHGRRADGRGRAASRAPTSTPSPPRASAGPSRRSRLGARSTPRSSRSRSPARRGDDRDRRRRGPAARDDGRGPRPARPGVQARRRRHGRQRLDPQRRRGDARRRLRASGPRARRRRRSPGSSRRPSRASTPATSSSPRSARSGRPSRRPGSPPTTIDLYEINEAFAVADARLHPRPGDRPGEGQRPRRRDRPRPPDRRERGAGPGDAPACPEATRRAVRRGGPLPRAAGTRWRWSSSEIGSDRASDRWTASA